MYLFKKKVFFSAVLVLLGVGLIVNQSMAQEKADGKLYGKVVDKSSTQALADVEVKLQNTEKKATTGEKGMYAFKSLKTGTYTVTVDAKGYKDWEKEVKVTAEGKELTIKLKPTEN